MQHISSHLLKGLVPCPGHGRRRPAPERSGAQRGLRHDLPLPRGHPQQLVAGAAGLLLQAREDRLRHHAVAGGGDPTGARLRHSVRKEKARSGGDAVGRHARAVNR